MRHKATAKTKSGAESDSCRLISDEGRGKLSETLVKVVGPVVNDDVRHRPGWRYCSGGYEANAA